MTAAALALPKKVKPKLRGVSHFIAFCCAVAASSALVGSPRSGEPWLGGVIYGATVLLMFGLSALYHRPMWSYRARRVLRRLDHSGICFLIVGSVTAFWTLAPPSLRSPVQLGVMWCAAVVCAVAMVVWTDMPRSLRAGSYFVLGLASLPLLVNFPAILGWADTGWVAAAAAIYLVGAVVYARRWPALDPRVFGFHEVLHLLVIIAAAIHFGVIVQLHWAA